MEEQKKSNVVEMGAKKEESAQTPKYTYEQLNDICGKLFRDNQYLKNRCEQDEEIINTFNRLGYLLKIVEINNASLKWHFSDSFMEKTIKEIEEVMTVPEKKPEEKEA